MYTNLNKKDSLRFARFAAQQKKGVIMKAHANAKDSERTGSSAVANNISRSNTKRNNSIPGGLQAKMEGALSTSFSDVTVHANSSKAVEVGALAFTQGSNIHFAPGQYSPGSAGGNKLLAHELTHVAQQREGRVQATGSVAGLPLNDNPSLEREADSISSKV
jgi:hypothetical protein